VAEEFDERSPHEVAHDARAGHRDVEEREDRERDADADGEHHLADDVASTETRQTLEPQ